MAQVLSDWLLYEEECGFSRALVTAPTGLTLVCGEVLGKVTKGAATGAAAAHNTGDGTITAAPTVGAAAKVGVYIAKCVKAASNGGVFQVVDPDGIHVGFATVGVEFTTHLTFTIADGSADFIVGDMFTITVAAGNGKYKKVDLTAGTGESVAAAININHVVTSGDTIIPVLLRGPAVIKPGGLTWPSGWSAQNKTDALAELALLGIQAKTDY